MPETTKYIDYLTEDDPIPGQKYFLFSYITPKSIEDSKIKGAFKIKGVYSNREKADAAALKFRKQDPDFHVWIGEVGKFMPWDPSDEQVEDENYRNRELNNLVHNYRKQRESALEEFENRKDEMLRKTALEEDSKLNKIRNRLREKANKKLIEVDEVDEIDDVVEEEKVSKTTRRNRRRRRRNKERKLESNVEDGPQLMKKDEVDDMVKRMKEAEEKLRKERENLSQSESVLKKEQNEADTLNKELAEMEKLYNNM